MERMRACCAIWECKDRAGRFKALRSGVRRRTEWIEFVKMRVFCSGWWRRRA